MHELVIKVKKVKMKENLDHFFDIINLKDNSSTG